MPPADQHSGDPGYLTVAGRLYELCSRLLYGPGTWFEACRAAAAGGPAEIADLIGRLAPGHDVARALATRGSWPGRSRLSPAGPGTGSALSAARAAAAVVTVLSGAERPDETLLGAAAHWRRANVLPGLTLTGAGIRADEHDGAAAATARRLAVLADDDAPDGAVWGFLDLLVRALRDGFPTADRDVEVPVLFDRRATGGHGLLRVQRMTTGPPGLYPDPRAMMFLVADGPFAAALDAAWRTAPHRLAGRCVVWRLTTDGQPCDQVEGGSLGGAFGVALAELARPLPARLRPRRLDRRCAVTAALRPDGRLAEVAGTRNKLEAAVRRRLRVVLAPPSESDPPGASLLRAASVRYAADLAAAVRLARTRVNTTFVALMAAVLLAASGIAGGAVYARQQAQREHERAVGTRLLADVSALRTQDPPGALLLEALAVRLGGSGARPALIRDLLANRYAGTLPAPDYTQLCGGPQSWSPDGSTVVAAHQASVLLWNVEARTRIRTIAARGRVTGCAFAPDGRTLAIAAGGGLSLVALDTPTAGGDRLVVDTGVQDVQFAPNGMLATVSDDGPVRLWSAATARPLGTISIAPGDRISLSLPPRLAFSPDSRTLAVNGRNPVLYDVRRPATPRLVARLPIEVKSTAFSPDGSTLATGMSDATTALWDVDDLSRPLHATAPNPRTGFAIGSVAFTPDGRGLVTDGGVLGEVWNVDDDRRPTSARQLTAWHQIVEVALAPAGDIAVVQGGEALVLWRLAGRSIPRPLATVPLSPAPVTGVAFAPATTASLVIAAGGGAATLWNVADPAHPAPGPAIGTGERKVDTGSRFSPDGRRMAVFDHGAIATWEITDGTFRRTGKVPAPATGDLVPFALSSAGVLLAAEAADQIPGRNAWNRPSLWDVSGTPRMLSRLPGVVSDATFAPDGHTLVTRVDRDETAWWDVRDPRHPVRAARQRIQGDEPTGPAAFSTDGRLMAGTEADAPGTMWDTSDPGNPVELGRRAGLPGLGAGDAAFAGSTLVLGTRSVINVWDLSDPANATRLTQFDNGATGAFAGRLALSPSGILATVVWEEFPRDYYTGDNVVRLWDLRPILEVLADPVADACRVARVELSADLWRRYAPDLPPRPVCR